MNIKINLTKKEEELAKKYAKTHNITLEKAFKEALFTLIEDEYDIKIAEEAYNEYVKNNKLSRPIEELWQELHI